MLLQEIPYKCVVIFSSVPYSLHILLSALIPETFGRGRSDESETDCCRCFIVFCPNILALIDLAQQQKTGCCHDKDDGLIAKPAHLYM